MMPNRPEYMAIWLGITSVGGVVSLINTQLRGPSLAHCIDIVAPKHVIVAGELIAQFRSAPLSSRPKIWAHGRAENLRPRTFAHRSRGRAIFARAADASGAPRRDDRRSRADDLHLRHDRTAEGRQCQPSPADAMELLVRRPDGYRTGRPHVRLPADVSLDRRRGGDRRAFGARRLGRDRRKILRAAVSGTTSPNGTARCFNISASSAAISSTRRSTRASASIACDCAAAMGLRADVWEEFQSRFEIPRILEFYAATEGNVSLYNVEGKARRHRPRAVVPDRTASRSLWCKFDDAAGAPARDAEWPLHPLRDRRTRRGDRPNSRQRGAIGRPRRRIRGLYQRRRYRAKNPPQRVRGGRRLVSAPAI